jgi:hypothetical protein
MPHQMLLISFFCLKFLILKVITDNIKLGLIDPMGLIKLKKNEPKSPHFSQFGPNGGGKRKRPPLIENHPTSVPSP